MSCRCVLYRFACRSSSSLSGSSNTEPEEVAKFCNFFGHRKHSKRAPPEERKTLTKQTSRKHFVLHIVAVCCGGSSNVHPQSVTFICWTVHSFWRSECWQQLIFYGSVINYKFVRRRGDKTNETQQSGGGAAGVLRKQLIKVKDIINITLQPKS